MSSVGNAENKKESSNEKKGRINFTYVVSETELKVR